MTKSSALRTGKIVFFPGPTKQEPKRWLGRAYVFFRDSTRYLDDTVAIPGGFWVIAIADRVGPDDVEVHGPYATLEISEGVAERLAERLRYRFRPDDGEMAEKHAEDQRRTEAARDGSR